MLHLMTIMCLNFNIVLSKLQFSSLQLIFTPPFLSGMMHALTIIVIVNNYYCCDFSLGKFMLALKNSQKREELESTLMTHPFFPFINDNLNQTTSKNQASWHRYQQLHHFLQWYSRHLLQSECKGLIPCQIHNSMSVGIICDQTLQFILIPLEYTSHLFVVASKGLCAKLESINTLISLRIQNRVAFYKELLKTNSR